jgi:hypothetical protein
MDLGGSPALGRESVQAGEPGRSSANAAAGEVGGTDGGKQQRRQIYAPGHEENRAARYKIPLQDRESFGWIQALREIGSPPEGVCGVQVGDRGEDMFGVYDEAQRQRVAWLIRLSKDRRVQTPEGSDSVG